MGFLLECMWMFFYGIGRGIKCNANFFEKNSFAAGNGCYHCLTGNWKGNWDMVSVVFSDLAKLQIERE